MKSPSMQFGCLVTVFQSTTELMHKHTKQHVEHLIKVEIELKKAKKAMKKLKREQATIKSILDKKPIGSATAR